LLGIVVPWWCGTEHAGSDAVRGRCTCECGMELTHVFKFNAREDPGSAGDGKPASGLICSLLYLLPPFGSEKKMTNPCQSGIVPRILTLSDLKVKIH